LTVSLLTLAVVAAVLSFGLLAWADICRDRQEAEESLHEGRQLLAAKQYELALERFDDGLQHCQAMTANPKMVLLLRQEQSRCQRAREIERLHQLAERMRYLCASLNNPREISPALRQHWTEVWRSRHQVLDARLEGLDGTLREQLRLDLLDMAVIWADLLLREEKRSRENVLERVRLLAEVETLFGSNPVLRDLPLLSEKQTGSVPRAVLDQERSTAWEQFALGRRCLLRGELTEAAAFFQQAVNKQPNGFWPSYYQGICAYRLGAYQEAVTAFRACIALAPESALSYYNRGIAYAKLGGNYCPLALGDFSRALELDPKLAEAALNRGVMFLKNGQLARAHQDFQKALQLGADEAQVHFNLAQLYLLREDRKAALASLRLALKATSALAEARFLLQELQMSPGAGAGN
jgi:Flp pilus assembly protein TadD